jgi:hypothetical protein
MLKCGKAFEQSLENFLDDVVDGVRLRHQSTDPSPDQRLIEDAELTPGLVIIVTQEPIQEAERGIDRGHGSSPLAEHRRRTSPGEPSFAFETQGARPPVRGLDYGIIIDNEVMATAPSEALILSSHRTPDKDPV